MVKFALVEKPFNISVMGTDIETQYTPGYAVVRPEYVGICGSDVLYYTGRYKDAVYPEVRGHEFVGIIDDIDKDVSGYSIRDRVVVNPNIPCGTCYYCKKGYFSYCSQLKVIGANGTPGALQEKIQVPIKNMIKIPEAETDYRLFVLTEPLSIAIHSIKLTELGKRVVIFGYGNIGRLACEYLGNKQIRPSIVDIDKKALSLARGKGYDAYHYNKEENLVVNCENKYDSVIVNCPITTDVFTTAISLLEKGGKVIIVGLSYDTTSIDFTTILRKEISVYTSFKNTHTEFIEAFRFILSGKITSGNDHLHLFDFCNIKDAFNYKVEHPLAKVVIDMGINNEV